MLFSKNYNFPSSTLQILSGIPQNSVMFPDRITDFTYTSIRTVCILKHLINLKKSIFQVFSFPKFDLALKLFNRTEMKVLHFAKNFKKFTKREYFYVEEHIDQTHRIPDTRWILAAILKYESPVWLNTVIQSNVYFTKLRVCTQMCMSTQMKR